MTRWEPDARGRLQQAALALYTERGFDQTTVAEIAARAGLTERTFFRYFADKREVLFSGAGELEKSLVESIAGAKKGAAPLDAVVQAFDAVARDFEERRDFAGQRHAIISSNAELQERELIKLASLASAIAEALRRRGVTDPAASVTAEAGVAVFKIAFARWIEDKTQANLSRHLKASLGALKAVAAGKRR